MVKERCLKEGIQNPFQWYPLASILELNNASESWHLKYWAGVLENIKYEKSDMES